MIDETQYLINGFNQNFNDKYKPCALQFYDSQIVPTEDDEAMIKLIITCIELHTITPLRSRFRKIPIEDDKPFIYEHELIEPYVTF